jgi:hypothetical protein
MVKIKYIEFGDFSRIEIEFYIKIFLLYKLNHKTITNKSMILTLLHKESVKLSLSF